MKQLKLWMVALTLIMGVSLTSCLKGEDNNIALSADIVKVNQDFMSITFTNSEGKRLVPSKDLLSADGKFAYVYYMVDLDKFDKNAESWDITLLNNPLYIDGPSLRVTKPENVSANAPIISLETEFSDGKLKGSFFDDLTLILPISYKFRNVSNNDDYIAEQKKHEFTLVYDDSEASSAGVLKLYLRHYISDSSTGTTRTVDKYDYKAYDLTGVLHSYRAANNGSNPTKIEVTTEENKTTNEYDSGKISKRTYTYEYKTK